jgi:hypothetical protein
MSKILRFSNGKMFYATYEEDKMTIMIFEADTNKNVLVVKNVVSLDDAECKLVHYFEQLEGDIDIETDSLMETLILKYEKEPNDRNKKFLKTFYFLLKKMEYTNKKIFRVKEIIQRLDSLGVIIEKDFNPFE